MLILAIINQLNAISLQTNFNKNSQIISLTKTNKYSILRNTNFEFWKNWEIYNKNKYNFHYLILSYIIQFKKIIIIKNLKYYYIFQLLGEPAYIYPYKKINIYINLI